MTMLKTLADKQDLILLAEIGVLIHDLGKLSKEFTSQPSEAHSQLLGRSIGGNDPYHTDETDKVCTYFSIIDFHLKHDEKVKQRLSESQRREIAALADEVRLDWRTHGGNLDQVHQNLQTGLSGSPQLLKYLEDYREEVLNIPIEIRKAENLFTNVVDSAVVRVLEESSFESALQLTVPEVARQVRRLGDFVALHHQTPVCPRPALIALLRAGDGGADGFDSWVDKGQVDGQPSQTLATTMIATAFGHETQRLPVGPDEDGLKTVRDKFAEILADALSQVRNGKAKPAQVRARIFKAAETAFRQALGETRRAANDVTLWDHSYSVASLYKAALAGVLLEGWTEPRDIRWRFLRVSVDGLRFFAQAHHVTDILGRRRALIDAFDQVRQALEVKYPLGNEVYRDEDGSAFVMPALDNEGTREVEELVLKTFRQAGLGEELVPWLTWNDKGPVRDNMITAFGQLVAKEPPSPTPDPQATRGWWEDRQAKHQEICTVCGVRPIGYDVPRFYDQRTAYYLKAAEERKVCGVCLHRRGHRAQAWFTDPVEFRRTIWIDEVADETGRFALVVGRFDLNGWLDGTLVGTMLVAPNISKNPSPARIRRCWDTTRQFWLALVESHGDEPPELERIIAQRPFRLHINPANAAEVNKALGDYHVYDWPLRGGVTLSVVWVPDGKGGGYFLSADNLWYLARPEQLAFPEEALKDDARLLYEFSQVINGQRGVTLLEPSGYGRPAEIRTRVRLAQEGAVIWHAGSAYTPYIPILAEPATFMVLVPADKALAVARAIKAKYKAEMARVRDRLPLHLGLIFAPRRTPLRAVLEAGRAMLTMPAEWEEWRIVTSGRKATFSRDGRVFEWEYPIKMGDDQTPDVWYPHLLTVDPVTKDALDKEAGDFCLVDDLSRTVFIRPPRFDFEFLDTTARRFEIRYDEDGRRPRRTRPFLLNDLKRLKEIWDEMCRHLEKSQRYQVIATIEATRETWFGADQGGKSWSDGVFRQFVADTLAGAAWPKGHKWYQIEESLRKQLEDAGVTGELADLAELHMQILKE